MSFSVTDSLGRGDNNVRVEAEGDTGRITYTAMVSGMGSGTVTVSPNVNSSAFTQAISDINQHIGQVKQLLNATPPGLPSSTISSSVLPNALTNSFSRRLNDSTKFNHNVYEKKVEINKFFENAVIKVPVPEDSNWSTEHVRDLPVEFIIQEKDTFDRDTYSLVLRIPAEAFIETVSISQFPCHELFPDIDSSLDRFESDISSLSSRITNDLSEADDVVSTLESAGGGGIQNITIGDVQSLGSSTLTNLKTRAEQLDPKRPEVGSLQDRFDDLADRVNSVGLPRCADRFNNMIQSLSGDVNDLQLESNTLKKKRDNILSLLSNIGSIDCAANYSGVQSSIDEMKSLIGVGSFAPELNYPVSSERKNGLLDDIGSLRNEVRGKVPAEGPCLDDFLSQIDNIERTLREGPSFNPGTGNCEELVGTGQIPGTDYKEIKGDLNDLEGDASVLIRTKSLDGQNFSTSKRELLRKASNINSEITSVIPSGSSCFSALTGRLDDVESQISGSVGPQLGCGDISQSIRNQVAQFSSAAQTFSNADIIARRRDAKSSLVSEGERVVSTVEGNVNPENPCKAELLSRARSSLSGVKSAGVRPESAIPCSEKHPGVVAEVESFTNQTFNISPPVTPEDIQAVSSQGQDVIDMVENNVPADDPCRAELTGRIRSVTSRVEKLTSRVRISQGDETTPGQGREDLIKELLSSLNTLESTRDTEVETST